METYKVIADWEVFIKSIGKYIINRGDVGFMHRGNEIYIRTNNTALLEILKDKFGLISDVQPPHDLPNEGWVITHNPNFFPD